MDHPLSSHSQRAWEKMKILPPHLGALGGGILGGVGALVLTFSGWVSQCTVWCKPTTSKKASDAASRSVHSAGRETHALAPTKKRSMATTRMPLNRVEVWANMGTDRLLMLLCCAEMEFDEMGDLFRCMVFDKAKV